MKTSCLYLSLFCISSGTSCSFSGTQVVLSRAAELINFLSVPVPVPVPASVPTYNLNYYIFKYSLDYTPWVKKTNSDFFQSLIQDFVKGGWALGRLGPNSVWSKKSGQINTKGRRYEHLTPTGSFYLKGLPSSYCGTCECWSYLYSFNCAPVTKSIKTFNNFGHAAPKIPSWTRALWYVQGGGCLARITTAFGVFVQYWWKFETLPNGLQYEISLKSVSLFFRALFKVVRFFLENPV